MSAADDEHGAGARGARGALAEVPVRLRAFGAEPAAALAAVEEHGAGARARRAALGLAGWWGLALAALFVPVAHFVLVPACLLAGIVVGLRRLGETRTLVRLTGPCPRCGRAQAFEAAGRFPPRRPVTCAECRSDLQVEAGDVLSGPPRP